MIKNDPIEALKNTILSKEQRLIEHCMELQEQLNKKTKELASLRESFEKTCMTLKLTTVNRDYFRSTCGIYSRGLDRKNNDLEEAYEAIEYIKELADNMEVFGDHRTAWKISSSAEKALKKGDKFLKSRRMK